MRIRSIILKCIFALVLLYGLYLLWAVFGLGGGYKKMVPETHIIPFGYIGMVYIIFNQNEGHPKEYSENGSRIYRVPKSGILKTNFKGNFGWIEAGEKINFFYSMRDSLFPINKLLTEEEFKSNIDSNQVVVFEYGYGGAKSNFGFEADVLTYIIDSLKNLKQRDYILTKEKFENWNKN